MWLFTNFGFFSIVQRAGETKLTIRARVKADLDKLRDQYLPELGPTIITRHADYPCRAVVSHDQLAKAMGQIVADLQYPNFKGEVARCQGWDREGVYARVWSVMRDLARLDADAEQPS